VAACSACSSRSRFSHVTWVAAAGRAGVATGPSGDFTATIAISRLILDRSRMRVSHARYAQPLLSNSDEQ
jgi:hypothetical protein